MPGRRPKALAAAGAAAALGAGALAYAALFPPSQIFGPVLVAPRRPGEIALTFDDGPNPQATPELLDLLARYGVRAAFFLIGDFVRAQPGLVRAIAAGGHTIGSHTMSHPWLAWQSRARIRSELAGSQHLLEDTLGDRIRWFRPPHGARRPYVVSFARELGMRTVQWNIIANDWKPGTPERIAARVESGIAHWRARGFAANVVLHDGGHTTPEAARSRSLRATALLLNRQREERFVTLDDWA